jgi:hypothetical protein
VLGGHDLVEADGHRPGQRVGDLRDGLLVALAQYPPLAHVGPVEATAHQHAGRDVADRETSQGR